MTKLNVLAGVAVILAALTACGGGGGSSSGGGAPPPSGGGTGGGSGGGSGNPPPVGNTVDGVELEGGISGSGWNRGAIQGFSSVIVNDLAMNTDNANIFVEGVAATQGDLIVGQTVSIIGDVANSTATDVRYRADIKGPVTAITLNDPELGTAQLTVLGQPVRTNAATLFSDTSLALLQVGDVLEVSGTENATGELVASYVDLTGNLTEYKVVGLVANVDATANTFNLRGLEVAYGSATLQDFSGADPANGDLVEVKGAPADFTAEDPVARTPAQLTASRVERLPVLTINPTARLEVEGFIDRFNGSGDFDVNGRAVTTDGNTTYENGSVSSLGLNVKVEVEGTVNNNDVLVATKVQIKPTNAVRAEGTIDSISDNQVSLLGVTFVIRETTRLEDDRDDLDPFELADLAQGDYVEIRGFIDGSVVVASELDRDDFDPDARLRGPAINEDEAAGTFDILGVAIDGDVPPTQYEDDDDNTVTQAQFHALLEENDFVDVKWQNFAGNTGVAPDEISLELNDD